MLDDTRTPRQRELSDWSKTWATACSAMLEGNQQALARGIQGAQALSGEISGFAKARMLLAMEGWLGLAACRSPEDIMDYQTDFANKAMERCAQELRTLAQLTLISIERGK